MSTAGALISSEAIKLRRGAPLRLAVAAPVLLFVLQILTMFSRRIINATNPSALWTDLLSFGWVMWLGLFTPALIAFEAICLAGIEHSGRHWKQLFAMPAPRWRIFAVKMLACAVLVGVSFAAFAATTLAAVLSFSWARGLHLTSSTPWLVLTVTMLRAYAACWLLIVIHTWLSVRFPPCCHRWKSGLMPSVWFQTFWNQTVHLPWLRCAARRFP